MQALSRMEQDRDASRPYGLPILFHTGTMAHMKTTLDIHDELLLRAKRHAKQIGRPLRALVEDGLRQVLSAKTNRHRYRLPDLSVGNPDDSDPLESYSWQDLRELIYDDRETP